MTCKEGVERKHAAECISSGAAIAPRTSACVIATTCFAALGASVYLTGEWPSASTWLTLVLAGGFFALIIYMFVGGLMDEVWDLGDHLLVKKGATQARIDLANLLRAEASVNSSPERVTVFLIKPCAFGRQIAFRPAARKRAFLTLRNPIAEELMRRAHEARSLPVSARDH